MHDDGTPKSGPARSLLSRSDTIDERIHAILFEQAPDAQFVVDARGRILAANAQSEQMFGYPRETLLGGGIEMLIPERFAGTHAAHRRGYMGSPRLRTMGTGVELFGKRSDGSEIPVDIMLSPLEAAGGTLVLAVVRDVTERKRVEDETRQTREMHFKELHHRVKNNLQVISSLLFLQANRVADPDTLEVLAESRNRIKSIALIHEKFYRSPDYSTIDFADYVNDLIRDLFRTYSVPPELVRSRIEVEPIQLGIDTAIPCGLILNELVSNVFKHAFPKGASGSLEIEVRRGPGRDLNLVVRDDGVGLSPRFELENTRTLGLSLVRDLCRQLEGTVSIAGDSGTVIRMTLREPFYKERS